MKKVLKTSLMIVGIFLVLLVVVKLGYSFKARNAQAQNEGRGELSALLKSAEDLEQKGELLHAREILRDTIVNDASKPGIEEVQKSLDDLNMKIIFSSISVPGETTIVVVKEDDFLQKIANVYDTTVDFIKKQNGLTSDVVKPGMQLRLWTGKFSVLVDKSQNIFVLKSNGEVVKTYRVSTGKNNITPIGTFKIVNKLVNPDWSHDGKVIAAGSPDNILGTRWLGFNIPGYGIHGTTLPESIGKQATAGCVRMLNNEVEEVYALLPVGTEVTIID